MFLISQLKYIPTLPGKSPPVQITILFIVLLSYSPSLARPIDNASALQRQKELFKMTDECLASLSEPEDDTPKKFQTPVRVSSLVNSKSKPVMRPTVVKSASPRKAAIALSSPARKPLNPFASLKSDAKQATAKTVVENSKEMVKTDTASSGKLLKGNDTVKPGVNASKQAKAKSLLEKSKSTVKSNNTAKSQVHTKSSIDKSKPSSKTDTSFVKQAPAKSLLEKSKSSVKAAAKTTVETKKLQPEARVHSTRPRTKTEEDPSTTPIVLEKKGKVCVLITDFFVCFMKECLEDPHWVLNGFCYFCLYSLS